MGQWLEGHVELATGAGGQVASGASSTSGERAEGDARHDTFVGTNAAGHSITLASGTAVSPMEAVLLALGGCTGVDVVSTLRKMRQDVTSYAVDVRGERRDEHPRIYTRIVVEHVVRGANLKPDAVRRAIGLSANKYCSVSAMLEASSDMAITYRAIDTTTGAETRGAVPLGEPPVVGAD